MKIDYSHTRITAYNPKALRKAVIQAATIDLINDERRGDMMMDDDGCYRHTVWVNGRQVGYEARRVAGRTSLIRVDRIRDWPAVKITRLMADLRAAANVSRLAKSATNPFAQYI